ncbi:MAG: carbamoyltransferase [Planctomycetes bacterium]|nr:carbamoyltransferase [Planctomycetota bacterium]
MNILGISCFYHDSAAALLRDGDIVAAAQEERFTRKRHDAEFPTCAIDYCLREGGISPEDLDAVAFYDKPLLKFERILDTHLRVAPLGIRSFLMAIPLWVREKLWMRRLIRKRLPGYAGDILFTEHHESHAASAFFPSPFEEAAVLTVDGVGEWTTASFGVGKGNRVELLQELHFPHSLGLLYAAFTSYTGFKINSGEYKVMGLAPYGEPKYVQTILDPLVDLREDGSLRLNMEYFNFLGGLTMTNEKFHRLFGGPPRIPETKLTQREMDLARSIQEVCELAMLRMGRHVAKTTGMKNLCLAGGVALNCVANGKLLRDGCFERIWIQPASGDAGGSLGAALTIWHHYYDRPRKPERRDAMEGALLGPSFSQAEIEAFLARKGAHYQVLSREEILTTTAELLAQGNVVGWFQGRMEFGPRALGARSILGDPRDPTMQARMNLKIKFREGFRPFAPSVLSDEASRYFALEGESPYMLLVAPVREERRRAMSDDERKLWGIDQLNVARSDIPAVTHIDYSARVQTVAREDNPVYYDLIERFARESGCPVLVNTSFNVRGEPIVCTPEDAFRCFCRTGLDYLVIGNCLVDKKAVAPELIEVGEKWKKEFKPD